MTDELSQHDRPHPATPQARQVHRASNATRLIASLVIAMSACSGGTGASEASTPMDRYIQLVWEIQATAEDQGDSFPPVSSLLEVSGYEGFDHEGERFCEIKAEVGQSDAVGTYILDWARRTGDTSLLLAGNWLAVWSSAAESELC